MDIIVARALSFQFNSAFFALFAEREFGKGSN